MLVVLSPAKKLDFNSVGSEDIPATKPRHLKYTSELIDVMKKQSPAELGKLMKLSDALAKLNHQRYQDFSTSFTRKNSRQAVLAFSGDTYIGLGAGQFSDEDFQYAQDHLRILSGLYGVLRPLDLIQPYRLEMGTRLKNSRGSNLYEFWGDELAKSLNKSLKACDSRFLLNCSSNEYFQVVKADSLQAEVINPVFKQVKNGEARMLGMMAKRARGALANFLVKNQIDKPEYLKDFRADGYRFQKNLSSDTQFEFHRKA